MTSVHVGAERPYEVIIGRGLLPELVRAVEKTRTVAILHQPTIIDRAEAARAALEKAGIDAHRVELPDA
ncbi:MAG: 3-dehydroquinate synthase, partial [Pseudonocardiaceae bacterium]